MITTGVKPVKTPSHPFTVHNSHSMFHWFCYVHYIITYYNYHLHYNKDIIIGIRQKKHHLVHMNLLTVHHGEVELFISGMYVINWLLSGFKLG